MFRFENPQSQTILKWFRAEIERYDTQTEQIQLRVNHQQITAHIMRVRFETIQADHPIMVLMQSDIHGGQQEILALHNTEVSEATFHQFYTATQAYLGHQGL